MVSITKQSSSFESVAPNLLVLCWKMMQLSAIRIANCFGSTREAERKIFVARSRNAVICCSVDEEM